VRGQNRRGELHYASTLQFAVHSQAIPDQFEHFA